MSDQMFRRVNRSASSTFAGEPDENGRRLISSKKKVLLADPPHHESVKPDEENSESPVERRRQIDPTTCERDYSNDEIEFMKAMDDYKRRNGRPFPTWSEVLEVVRSLGYVKNPMQSNSVAEST